MFTETNGVPKDYITDIANVLLVDKLDVNLLVNGFFLFENELFTNELIRK